MDLSQIHGIRKVAINDIAQKVVVSPATVYNPFGSKEDLMRATVEHFLTNGTADFRNIIEGDLSFLKKLE